MTGRPPKSPIYVLPHGIEVIGEYAPSRKNRYWRVRIRPHRFFPDVPIRFGGAYVRRSRVVLASKLGRALTTAECAHHGDEDRDNDVPGNIESLTAAEHNKHHKTGTRHTEKAKQRISDGMRLAMEEGRHAKPNGLHFAGQTHSEESKRRLSETRKKLIASGAIQKPTPPSMTGKKLSDATKEKMRQAKLAYWKTKKGISA